jgi:hypothetical protein
MYWRRIATGKQPGMRTRLRTASVGSGSENRVVALLTPLLWGVLRRPRTSRVSSTLVSASAECDVSLKSAAHAEASRSNMASASACAGAASQSTVEAAKRGSERTVEHRWCMEAVFVEGMTPAARAATACWRCTHACINTLCASTQSPRTTLTRCALNGQIKRSTYHCC